MVARRSGAHSAAQLAGYKTETDFAYICTARWASEYFSASAASPVWELQFAYGYNSRSGQADAGRTVSHSAELAFVFSSPQADGTEAGVEDMSESVRLADVIVAYWTNFAKTGDPNGVTDLGQQLPNWPQTQGGRDRGEDLVLRVAGADDGDITVLDTYHSEACDYWRQHWQPWDAQSCHEGCFGGCISCDGERLDVSEYGEPTGGAC